MVFFFVAFAGWGGFAGVHDCEFWDGGVVDGEVEEVGGEEPVAAVLVHFFLGEEVG